MPFPTTAFPDLFNLILAELSTLALPFTLASITLQGLVVALNFIGRLFKISSLSPSFLSPSSCPFFAISPSSLTFSLFHICAFISFSVEDRTQSLSHIKQALSHRDIALILCDTGSLVAHDPSNSWSSCLSLPSAGIRDVCKTLSFFFLYPHLGAFSQVCGICHWA